MSALLLASAPAEPVLAAGQYAASPADADRLPGTLIRAAPIAGAPEGAQAWRILYRSRGLNGEAIAVSGLAIVPQGKPPATGRPVVAWAHPTTGVVPQCAPSGSMFRFMMIPGLRDFLRRGFVVTATDYPGLGTGAVHPFLIGSNEGAAVLDSVRAAHSLPGAYAGARFALWGHSQGGQAALFAGSMASQYAPELRLVGVAAAAPATDLAALFRSDLGTHGGENLTAMTLWSWSRLFGASYSQIVAPAAQPAVAAIAQQCVGSLRGNAVKKKADRVLDTSFLTVDDVTSLQPWSDLLARNSAPVLPRTVPLFIAQGTTDQVVRPNISSRYARAACTKGDLVTYHSVPNTGHLWIAFRASRDAASWIADRFAEAPPPTDCTNLTGS
jgi:pimeloyl-ACP methyl ester carboxylesterase